MHLTRVFLDRETAALRGIHDAYDWHQRAWDAFPHLDGARNASRGDGAPRHFLTRLDEKDSGYQLLLLSPSEPSRPAWCPEHERNWRSKAVAPSFLQHSRYRFSLRANPTWKQTSKGPDGRRNGQGKRVPLHEPDDLNEWMARKASASGFTLDLSLRTVPLGLRHFANEKERRLGTLHIVDFEGVLRVTNQPAFESAFANGLGSAKAFGCGLLVLQPLD